MASLTYDENDKRLFGSSEKEQSFKRFATFLFLIGSFSFIFGLMGACAAHSTMVFTVFGAISLVLSFIAIGFLIISRQYNDEYNIASQWRESYWQAKRELCELPMEKLKELCRRFVTSGDPKSYKLRFVSRETPFSCKFTYNDFNRALKDYGKKSIDYVLNWTPVNDDKSDPSLVHSWFAEE